MVTAVQGRSMCRTPYFLVLYNVTPEGFLTQELIFECNSLRMSEPSICSVSKMQIVNRLCLRVFEPIPILDQSLLHSEQSGHLLPNWFGESTSPISQRCKNATLLIVGESREKWSRDSRYVPVSI